MYSGVRLLTTTSRKLLFTYITMKRFLDRMYSGVSLQINTSTFLNVMFIMCTSCMKKGRKKNEIQEIENVSMYVW